MDEKNVHQEIVNRLLFSIVKPYAKFAAKNVIGLKSAMQWCELAYFHELKGQDLKMREIADAMNVSMRKVADLSKKLKRNFLKPEEEVELTRRIEFALWVEPLSAARLAQTLSSDQSDIDEALETLLSQNQIVRIVDSGVQTYSLEHRTRRLVDPQWAAKIDGLNHLLDTVFQTIMCRFIEEREDSFARTLQMRIRVEDTAKLKQFYESTIFPFLEGLDEEAKKSNEVKSMNLSILWAPENENDI